MVDRLNPPNLKEIERPYSQKLLLQTSRERIVINDAIGLSAFRKRNKQAALLFFCDRSVSIIRRELIGRESTGKSIYEREKKRGIGHIAIGVGKDESTIYVGELEVRASSVDSQNIEITAKDAKPIRIERIDPEVDLDVLLAQRI